MSALDDLMKKRHTSNLERCVLTLADPLRYDEDYVSTEQAAAELAALRSRLAALEAVAEAAREAIDAMESLPFAGNILTTGNVRTLAEAERKLAAALERLP